MTLNLDLSKTLIRVSAVSICGVVAANAKVDQLDVNKDGRLSVTEAGKGTQLIAVWSTVDTDHDGVFSRTELSAFERLQEKSQEYKKVPNEESGGAP
jgi:hypothetical protein